MDLTDYLRAIRGRWPLVVSAGIVGLIAAFLTIPGAGAHAGGQGTYAATAVLLQAPEVEDPIESTARLVRSKAVLRRVAAALSGSALGPIRAGQVTAEIDKTSATISITAVSPRAAELANAFAYQTVDEFRARQRDAAQDEAVNATGLEVLQPAESVADTIGSVSSASRNVRMLLGLVLGLVIGSALALVLHRFGTRPRDRLAVERSSGLPVLAEIPQVRRRDRQGFAVVSRSQPDSSAAEAYRSLGSSLLSVKSWPLCLGAGDPKMDEAVAPTTGPDPDRRVILITSARSGEGKTTTVVNLAACLAEADRRVLVLDCNFRGPATHLYFGVTPSAGLSDLVSSTEPLNSTKPIVLSEHARPTNIAGVELVSAGTMLGRSAMLPARMAELVIQARELADIVLVDSAPLLPADDAMDLMPYVDTVLVVAQVGRTAAEQAARTSELLARACVPVIGVALVGGRAQTQRQPGNDRTAPSAAAIVTRSPPRGSA